MGAEGLVILSVSLSCVTMRDWLSDSLILPTMLLSSQERLEWRHTRSRRGAVIHGGTLTDKSGPREDVYRPLTNADADLLLSVHSTQFSLQTSKENNAAGCWRPGKFSRVSIIQHLVSYYIFQYVVSEIVKVLQCEILYDFQTCYFVGVKRHHYAHLKIILNIVCIMIFI